MDNPLVAVRRAQPGEPSLRDFAKQLRFSYETLRKFETGLASLSDQDLAAYAKAVKLPVAEVLTRFHRVRLEYHEAGREDARRELARLGVSGKRAGRPTGFRPDRR